MSRDNARDLELGAKQYTVKHVPFFGMVVMYRTVEKSYVLHNVWSKWRRAGISELNHVTSALKALGEEA